jgi:hypothetical protein
MQSITTRFQHDVSKDIPATIAIIVDSPNNDLLSDAIRQQINQGTKKLKLLI